MSFLDLYAGLLSTAGWTFPLDFSGLLCGLSRLNYVGSLGAALSQAPPKAPPGLQRAPPPPRTHGRLGCRP